MAKLTNMVQYCFRGAGVPPVAADSGPFVRDVDAGGTVTANQGAIRLQIPAAAGASRATVFQADSLPFDISDIIRVEMLVKSDIDLANNPNTILAIGLCHNFDATLDNMIGVYFRSEGDNKLLVESNDGVRNIDDIETGFDIQPEFQRLAIDFARGTNTQSFPSVSTGGVSDIRFFAGNATGALRDIRTGGTRFDLSAHAGGLQLFAQIEKTAGADVGSLWIRDICVTVKDN